MLHHSMDIHCYLFNQTLKTYKKIGNEKPRFALNLLLMTNFVSKKLLPWIFMPEVTKIILATSHHIMLTAVTLCIYMYLMEKMNTAITMIAFSR